ncbi:sugar phosphate nucleotidyltransferase, partial [Methylobacterium sp. Leaf361]|uniref:sugar phosphate nucleotidyltransferase n=1 Tax=Methylobacterium sp. Leaf361 TaxID=1736352 RepID=UPI001FCD1AC0
MSRPSIQIHPMILCGGTGTRLWPASRESMPKQFARLVDAERSTFQATLARVSDAAVFATPTVIASAEARFIVAEQRDQLGLSADILLEPQGRDSAAAVAVAALHAAASDPQAVVLIMAADHVVPDTAAFVDAVRRAAAGAQAGYTMTLGIEPDRPATDYGYIR